DGFIGLDTPKSGVYEKGYMVVHIGFGVDKNIQLPKVLNDIGVKTYLYGKVADIVENDDGVSKFGVDTKTLLNYLSTDLDSVDNGFFCLNVQETDLAGHRCEAKTYADVLKVADEVLGEIFNKLRETDCMIVMADHGNDPYSGRSQHTRERVPLLIYNKNFVGQNFGERETMSDVGQTAANYFGAKLINGKSLF
ncbi:MAG: alkaline phosphatase family protein, partial [Clostridia bacterium]